MAAYIQLRNQTRREKAELASISAQDEFAKWARKKRAVDKLQADLDQASISISQHNSGYF